MLRTPGSLVTFTRKLEEKIIKPFRIFYLFTIASVLCLSIAQLTPAARSVGAGQHFSVREYDKFHDVLHPLEHEALPNKDFRRIRANAARLVRLGKAMVRLGVPRGMEQGNIAEFRRELRKFNQALNQFSRDARTRNNRKLETSFSAVHDSFEMLAGMLPRR